MNRPYYHLFLWKHGGTIVGGMQNYYGAYPQFADAVTDANKELDAKDALFDMAHIVIEKEFKLLLIAECIRSPHWNDKYHGWEVDTEKGLYMRKQNNDT